MSASMYEGHGQQPEEKAGNVGPKPINATYIDVGDLTISGGNEVCLRDGARVNNCKKVRITGGNFISGEGKVIDVLPLLKDFQTPGLQCEGVSPSKMFYVLMANHKAENNSSDNQHSSDTASDEASDESTSSLALPKGNSRFEYFFLLGTS